MTIDDTFRNLNGMQWQLGFIKCAFTNSSVGNHQPSKMFCDVVNMYLNDREKYDEILSEAKARIGQCEDKSEQDCKRSRDEGMRKDRFVNWLEKENISEQGRAKMISTLEKCSQYGVTHKKMKLHIWDIGNVNLYESVIEGLRNTSNQHVQYNNKPYVLIWEEKLMNLLQEEIREMLTGYPIPSITGEKILMHLPKILKKHR